MCDSPHSANLILLDGTLHGKGKKLGFLACTKSANPVPNNWQWLCLVEQSSITAKLPNDFFSTQTCSSCCSAGKHSSTCNRIGRDVGASSSSPVCWLPLTSSKWCLPCGIFLLRFFFERTNFKLGNHFSHFAQSKWCIY